MNEKCNLKQKLNPDKCWCECQELVEWISLKNDYMWNPSTSDCECNKVYKIDKYLDTKNMLLMN